MQTDASYLISDGTDIEPQRSVHCLDQQKSQFPDEQYLLRFLFSVKSILCIGQLFDERCTRRKKGGWRMEQVKAFLKEEDGVGVVEIILILVVLISLVLIFKDQLTSIVNNIFSKIVSQSSSV